MTNKYVVTKLLCNGVKETRHDFVLELFWGSPVGFWESGIFLIWEPGFGILEERRLEWFNDTGFNGLIREMLLSGTGIR